MVIVMTKLPNRSLHNKEVMHIRQKATAKQDFD